MSWLEERAHNPWMRRVAVWAAVFLLLYLLRDFFFIIFMTFLFSRMALGLIAACERRWDPTHSRHRLRPLLTAAIFLLGPLLIVALLGGLAVHVVGQGDHLLGWLGQLDPETELARVLEPYVGRSRFQSEYGSPADERFRKALAEFQANEAAVTREYAHFPSTVAWVEGSLARLTADAKARDAQLEACFQERQKAHPAVLPYSFTDYRRLKTAHARGPAEFARAFRALHPSTAPGDSLQEQFQETKQHELFESWWSTNPNALYLRKTAKQQLLVIGTWLLERLESALAWLVDLPLQLATALILSFFICLDFPRLQSGFRRLHSSRLGPLLAEIGPPLSRLSHLVLRSLRAQGLIALCNAVTMFLGLSIIGVQQAALLSAMVFVLCLVPVVGLVLSLIPIALIALIQPGGGPWLVAKVALVVLVLLLLESFVYSPRIFGKMMELHPVLIIAVLPLAQYFFGIWGVILAAPVLNFLIHDCLLPTESSLERPPDPPPTSVPMTL